MPRAVSTKDLEINISYNSISVLQVLFHIYYLILLGIKQKKTANKYGYIQNKRDMRFHFDYVFQKKMKKLTIANEAVLYG